MLNRRFTVPALALVLAAGVALGVRVGDAASGDRDFASLQMIEEAFGIITQNYVEQVDSNELAADAIEGMLAGLDPHSVFIPAEEMQGVREAFDASFEGIGIYFEFIEAGDRDTIAVLMPIAGGPSVRPACRRAIASFRSTTPLRSASTRSSCSSTCAGHVGLR